MGGGGHVPARCGLSALGCRFGDDRGGEGVEVRGVDDVTHLVLRLKDEKCCRGCCEQSFTEKIMCMQGCERALPARRKSLC